MIISYTSHVPKHNLGIMGYNNYVPKQSIDYTLGISINHTIISS